MVERRLILRDRIIGVLLRHTRKQNGRTKAECADALGVSTGTLDAYEEGRESISLPELEVLGYVLDTPISRLLDHEAEVQTEADDPDFEATIGLRHRIIGALLRQARTEAGLTQEDLAEVLNCSPDCIAEYEHSEQSVPVAELELLAQHLDLPFKHFLDGDRGPVGTWHRQEEIDRDFHELPIPVQRFVTKPINIKYLELAMKLSKMPASKLRAIAEGLLEITY